MSNSTVSVNPWVKLMIVSLVGIVLIFVILWGISSFGGYYGYGNMRYGQMNGMLMQNDMYGMQSGMNMGNSMQGGMNMGNSMQGGMNMGNSMQGGMNMGNSMQGGMGMMGGMGMQGGMGMMGGMGMH